MGIKKAPAGADAWVRKNVLLLRWIRIQFLQYNYITCQYSHSLSKAIIYSHLLSKGVKFRKNIINIVTPPILKVEIQGR